MAGALKAAGITSPFPIQTLTIGPALEGRDICGKAPTGSGKTLAFGLPMIERTRRATPRRPRALVLVPTRELANQAAESLAPIARMRGLKVAPIYGGVPIRRHGEWLRMGIDIVIATPGRLNDLIERGEVSLADVGTVVVDEADQMADMGFMPQVRFALDQVTGPHQTMLFSATLDGEVDKLVRRYQNDPVTLEVEINADQIEAVSQRFIAVQDHEKVAVAADIVAGPERSLLFVRTQRGADRLGQQLERLGLRAGVLHGGISQGQRERTLRAFAQGHAPVLVATNVAARGLHVDDVNIVIHYDPPEEDKVFVHRSGRTARAGASGVVVTLVLWDQLRDVDALRARAGLRETIVGMSPGDPRLADLASWEPPLEDIVAPPPASVSFSRGGGGGQRGGGQRGGGYGARRGAPMRRR
ncbi:MAG: DEAD/DEAH box helicase [Dehalococcoidia bacterium]